MCRLLPVLLLALSPQAKADKPGYSSYSIGVAAHNSAIYSLYTEGTAMKCRSDPDGDPRIKDKPARTSGYVRYTKSGDMVIAIPETVRRRYKVRFFDGQENLLFEVKQIRDSWLVIEKYNFFHAGWYRYELFRDNVLVERSAFLIKTDP